jgi:uncharacterized protein
MKDSLLEIIVCPVCKESLELTITEKDDTEIISGVLTCVKCKTPYPIKDGIPNLLPQHTENQQI